MTTSNSMGPWEHGNEAIKVMADRQKPWNGTVFQQGVDDQAAALVALTFGATVDECVQAAVLIAAAPELLEALKEAHRALMFYEWYNNPKSGWASSDNVTVRGMVDAAIAKATGEAA